MPYKYVVEIYPEICCEDCGEVIHNHFDCPICKTKDAGTSMYGQANSHDYPTFECESCPAKFRILNRDGDNLTVDVINVR
jgi:hypothetical protein